jgi:membrane protein
LADWLTMFKPSGFLYLWRILISAVRQFLAVQGPFLASGLAFDVLIYCIPLLFLIISIMGFFFAGSDQGIQGAVHVLVPLIPGSEQIITDNILMIVEGRNRFGLIGCVLFFIFSTTMFGSARTVLNTVMGVTQPRNFFIGKGIDLLVSVFFSGLFGLTIALISLLAVTRALADQISFLVPLVKSGWVLNGKILGFVFTTVLFYILYRFCPARTSQPRVLWTAAFTGAVLLEISKWAFALYVSMAHSVTLLYGTLSGLLFLFLWVYYACTVFLFAGALAWAMDGEQAKTTAPM